MRTAEQWRTTKLVRAHPELFEAVLRDLADLESAYDELADTNLKLASIVLNNLTEGGAPCVNSNSKAGSRVS